MDKKNIILGLTMLGLAFGLMFWQNSQTPVTTATNQSNPSLSRKDVSTETTQQLADSDQPVAETKPHSLIARKTNTTRSQTTEEIPETYAVLENDFIAVKLTSKGGAIKEVALKEYPATQNSTAPFLFNEAAALPALSMSTSEDLTKPTEFAPTYTIVEQKNHLIRFEYESLEGLKIIREYTVNAPPVANDPYIIGHTTRLINSSNETIDLKSIFINLGTAPPVRGDQTGEFLNFGYYDGESAHFIKASEFQGSAGFLGWGSRLPRASLQELVPNVVWGSVKNQFFAAVLTPKKPGMGIFVQPTTVPVESDDQQKQQGITGSVEFRVGPINAAAEKILSMDYYVGPKEYIRLEALGDNQDLVMQFGFFGFISKLLLIMMVNLYQLIPNYGVAIILVTVFIKLLLWPLTATATRSSRRMANIQVPLKELRAKYKDNPQKIQQETMKLFKENKVNPAAGCLPILIQIPIFLGLFWMLRSASELRFASFLWISDLSMPDTVGHLGPIAVNILPLIMGVTMFFQMQMAPTPTTDAVQAKVFKLMPLIFLFICYSFPSGLVLYWTVQNLITILQQWITNRSTDPGAPPSRPVTHTKPPENKLIKQRGKRKKMKTA